MKPDVHSVFDEATNTASYVVCDPATKRCAIIDSVLDYDPKAGRTSTVHADKIIDHVRQNGLQVDWILDTHVHADHMTAAPYLKEKLGGTMGIGEHVVAVQETFKKIFNEGSSFKTDGSQFDRLFADGDVFSVGDIPARVMHTPGHTSACITFVIGDAAFVGDTLFMPDYGTARCDFPGGDADMLYQSIHKIFKLPPETRMFLCHDYGAPGRPHFVWETTVGYQRANNVHIHEGIGRSAFVALRRERDAQLAMPVLILPSVQVNMRAGHFPPPEDNGVSYLKIPLNSL